MLHVTVITCYQQLLHGGYKFGDCKFSHYAFRGLI